MARATQKDDVCLNIGGEHTRECYLDVLKHNSHSGLQVSTLQKWLGALLLVCVVVCLTKIFCWPQDIASETNQLRSEILQDSIIYIKRLSDEAERTNLKDGPVEKGYTGYDLKKTLAFLLDSMLGRIDRLERIIAKLQNSLKDDL